MTTFLVEKTKRTSKRNWISLQEQCGLEPKVSRQRFLFSCEPQDIEIFLWDFKDHNVTATWSPRHSRRRSSK